MSDYITSITRLYKDRSVLTSLKEEYSALLSKLEQEESDTLRIRLQNIGATIIRTQQGINTSVSQLYADPLTDPLLQIDEPNPVILLPLRMETRFVNAGTELWIRVYPDQIAIQTHETALTQTEIKAGKYYWKTLWQNRNLPDYDMHRKKAWSQISNQFGVNRATWIFLKTQPLKLKANEDFSGILSETDLDPGPVQTKTQAWSEAAKSFVMPDLLKLRLFIGNKLALEVQGNPIVQPLQVGPDPMSRTGTADIDWSGTGIAWLEDFDKAVGAGMGFKINLAAIRGFNAGVGFNRITVMGIRTLFDQSPLVTPPPAAGSKAFSALLESHRYTPGGLALVSQGTPTNNTEERRSGYRERAEFSDERYEQDLQRASASTDPDEMEDGKVLALALGLDPVLIQQLENSQHKDHKDAVMMNKALYSSTLGFYLRQLLHPLFKTEELDTIRSFFCSYITGRGPIPALRIGAQPYGILPTSNFKDFHWNKADKNYKLFQRMTELLSRLDAAYETVIPALPKLGKKKAPHLLLDEILGLYPNSETFYQRVGYSENFLRNCLGQAVPTNPNPLLEQLIAKFSAFTGSSPEGILELKKIVLERTTLLLDRNRLVDIVPASETRKIFIPDSLHGAVHGTNYMQWLTRLYIQGPIAGLERDYYDATDPRIEAPVLYKFLKHGFLTQLYKCIFHWLRTHGHLASALSIFHDGSATADFIASKEYLNVFSDHEDISAMELMSIQAPNLPFLAANETAAAYFLRNTDAILAAIYRVLRRRVSPEIVNDFKYLKEFLSTLEYLAEQPTARLERAMIEHLDCLSYRLDAWQTGLFNKKLALNRSAGLVTGTVLGAFGWLENVKPAAVTLMQEKDLPAELRPGTGQPIIKAADHGGYIHAPSVTQAKAAALLRNAYLHHHDPADPGMMAVNLSSTRVRKALEILEGMQKGHSTGELLGYRFERYLHDQANPLDKYIPDFRSVFPLGGKTLSNPGSNHEQASSTQSDKPSAWVARLDGLAMVNATKGQNVYPFGLRLGTTTGEDDIMKQGIDDLVDCIDAMKDLMVVESIHQLVQGNTERAGALLKSVHELKLPAKFESIRTPRTPDRVLTHRTAVLFKPGDFNNPVSPWRNVDMSLRAATEPGLNEWLADIIGAPDACQCTVTETETRTNGFISLEDLNLQPIDLIYLVPAELGKEESELSKRINYYYRVTQRILEKEEITIEYDKAAKNNLSMAELLPLLKLLKEIVTNSKALDGSDFDLQQYPGKANSRNLNIERSAGTTIDLGSLVLRKNNLGTALKKLMKKLSNAIRNPAATNAEIRECLVDCCDLEIRDAFPKNSVGTERQLRVELVAQAEGVLVTMEKMLVSAQKPTNLNAEELLGAFATFFGPGFKVLPVFHLAKNEEDEVERVALVQEAYNAERNIFSFITGKTNVSQEKHVQNWLNEIAYMRPKMASFETARLLFNSLQERQLGTHIMQLPYETDDSWLGIEFPAAMKPGRGKLSMMVHHFPENTSPDWARSDFSGLLVDEWIEEIPGREEQTGISFQYDQPSSQPPQSLLLAVSPTEGKKWNWDKLSDIIDDTLRRAKQRAVGAGDLAKTDWIGILPGVVTEFSDTKANVSLFFRN